MERKQFLDTLKLVEPALTTRELLPACSCFCFTGDTVYAFDDTVALIAPFESEMIGGVRGRPLLQWLDTITVKEIETAEEDGAFRVKAGRAKIELPILPEDDFVFELPNVEDAVVLDLDADALRCLKKAVVSMGTNSDHPWRLGLTICFEDLAEGVALVVYSSDNLTISKSFCYGVEEPEGFAPFIMPPRFVEILLSSCDIMAKVYIGGTDDEGTSYLAADLENGAELYARSAAEPDVRLFHGLFDRDADFRENSVVIPKSFPSMLARSEIMLQSSKSKFCTLKVRKNKVFVLTESSLGSNRDVVKLTSPHEDVMVMASPELMKRALPDTSYFFVVDESGERKICMFSPTFTHLVAVGQE